MGVDPQRQRRVGVAKLVRHPPDAFPSGQGMGRPGVPGVVEPERTYSLRLGSAAESQPNPGDVAAFKRSSGGRAEHPSWHVGPTQVERRNPPGRPRGGRSTSLTLEEDRKEHRHRKQQAESYQAPC